MYVCFFDLAKAIDTVGHNKLLDKLKLIGLDIHSLNWLKTYLHKRTQIVCINGVTSYTQHISYRVVLRGTLCPLLFLI